MLQKLFLKAKLKYLTLTAISDTNTLNMKIRRISKLNMYS